MKVTLIASTMLENALWNDTPWTDFDRHEYSDADTVAEFAGRSCYNSWLRTNQATRENADYLANIRSQRHLSVLEHGSATFYIEGVSRSLTHELIRHRHFSYSQESQRFCKLDPDIKFVVPPNAMDEIHLRLADAWARAMEAYVEICDMLSTSSLTLKQQREIARAVLPNMTPTHITMTGNHRSWLEFIDKRMSPAADAEICLLATTIAKLLVRIAPNIYADVKKRFDGESNG